MDVLTDVLRTLELRGTLYFRTEFSAPWSVHVPVEGNACRFHIVTHGDCHVSLPSTGQHVALSKGDLVFVPHGSAHVLCDSPETPPAPLEGVLAEAEFSGEGPLAYGGGGSMCLLVCGHFTFKKEVLHPILDALPRLLHVPASESYSFGWLDSLMDFLGEETRLSRPGAEATTDRLSEILFIQVIRGYLGRGGHHVGFLSALTDPHVGHALRAMHRDLTQPWTLESLAAEARLSRSAFAPRFSQLVGLTALRYLTRWRMQRAESLLSESDTSVAEVALKVGYRSEAAFNRAFKKHLGSGPGTYRRERRPL